MSSQARPEPRDEQDAQRIKKELARMEKLANVMDSAVRIPGTSIRLGLDAVIGVVPVVGDIIGGLISALMIHSAHRLKVPPTLIAKMVRNVLIDVFGGAIPLAGDAFDIFWRAHNRNTALLREHLRQQYPEAFGETAKPKKNQPLWVSWLAAIMVVAGVVFMVYWLSQPPG